MEANKDKDFDQRLSESEWWTNQLMKAGTYKGRHFYQFKPATEEEDKDEGIDYWVRFSNDDEEWTPIQFKMRVNADESKRDCPIVLVQPFYGCDIEYSNEPNVGLNKLGRDFLGIMGNDNDRKLHYIAVKNSKTGLYEEVYGISVKTLKRAIENIEEEWNNLERDESLDPRADQWSYRKDNLTEFQLRGLRTQPVFNGTEAQIFLQKNPSENFYKFNCYIKESLKEKSFKLSEVEAQSLKDAFYRYIAHQ